MTGSRILRVERLRRVGFGAHRHGARVQGVDGGAIGGCEIDALDARARALAQGEHMMFVAGGAQEGAIAAAANDVERPAFLVEGRACGQVENGELDAAQSSDPWFGHVILPMSLFRA